MAIRSGNSQGFLTRLKRNEAGNVLALTAAAIIPLIGLIGGGVDMSRAYLAKSRLQQACDAGALAGRRAMADGNWDTEAQTAAANFFQTNFEAGSYGTTGLTKTFIESDQVVSGTASVMVPTSLMKIFGNDGMQIAVACQAEMKIPNTDVMFVLDTTGSMTGSSGTDGIDRMEALRTAVENFYTSLEAAKGSNTRVRYGFVPYSVNVNVGLLLQRDWIVDSAQYQSREATFTNTYTNTTSNWAYVSGSYSTSTSKKQSNCPTDTKTESDTVTTTTSTDFDGNTITVTTTRRTTNGSDYSCSGKSGNYTVTEQKYTNYVAEQTNTSTPKYTWTYKQISYDVSGLKGNNDDGLMAGGSITANIENMSNYQPTSKTVDWNGCIEERDTVQATDYNVVPSGANDLDIDLVPTAGNSATQWRPAMAGLVYSRRNTSSGGTSWNTSTYQTDTNYYGPSGPCPTEARRLAEIDALSTLTTYLDSLDPTGNTYHDIGMLWGARLLSAEGIFASDNTTAPNGGSITRHLIFMTDGATEPNRAVYTPYGLEPLDRRRTSSSSVPSDTDLKNVVNARLAYLCTAVKNKNITVWVIAFGTTLTSNLSACASTGKAYEATNATELNDAFATIASQISQLRLTE